MTTFMASTVEDEDGGSRLIVTGEIDLSSADRLVEVAASSVDTGGAAVCRIDLSGVTFIDSTGVGALITIRNDLVKRGRSLALVAASRHVLRTLALTGLSETFGVDGADEG